MFYKKRTCIVFDVKGKQRNCSKHLLSFNGFENFQDPKHFEHLAAVYRSHPIVFCDTHWSLHYTIYELRLSIIFALSYQTQLKTIVPNGSDYTYLAICERQSRVYNANAELFTFFHTRFVWIHTSNGDVEAEKKLNQLKNCILCVVWVYFRETTQTPWPP